jgi:hypothetical protein
VTAAQTITSFADLEPRIKAIIQPSLSSTFFTDRSDIADSQGERLPPSGEYVPQKAHATAGAHPVLVGKQQAEAQPSREPLLRIRAQRGDKAEV